MDSAKPGQEEGVEREGENGKGKGKGKEKAKDTAQRDEYEDVVPTEDAGAGAGSDGMHGIPGSHLPAAGSAGDILRPLSEVAALFPSSGSLAWLATQHADRGQNYGSRINNDDGDSLTHAQSDSNVDATVDALRDFVAAVWQSPPPSASSGSSGRQGQGQGQGQGQDQDQDPYQYQYQENAPSPFAAVFPEGTNTSPLFLQRCDQRCDESETQPEPGTVLKYSESMQFFRRRPEDGGKIWKRRVLEYR